MKKHFKLYKSGKNWCVMALATFIVAMGVAVNADADTSEMVDDARITQVSDTNNVDDNSIINNRVTNINQNDDSQVTDNTTKGILVNPEATEVKTGWQQENGWTYYDKSGQKLKGRDYTYLPTIGKNDGSHSWYLVDNGIVQSGVQQWAGTYYDFDDKTYQRVDNNYVKSQWGDWYLFGKDGRIQSGVQSWAGTYYYFDPVTYLRVDNDYRQSQWGLWYMFGGDGRIATQVYQWAGTYYYFDPVTYLRVDNDYRQSQWGDWYMFGGDGRVLSGFCNWYGSLYFFDPTTYLKLTNSFFNGNGYWNNWDTYWADYSGVVHPVTYFSQFRPVWAGWGCAGAALTMLLSIHNIWPGVGNVISGTPQGGNGGQIGNPYSGAGFSRVIQPGALAAYGRRWYSGVADCSGASIGQIVNAVLTGHPVLYYGWSPYDAGGARNHCKVIYGYNRTNGLFHVYDPCYGNGGWGPHSEGGSAYDRGYNAWINWGQLASEYAGQAVSIY